MKLPLLSALFVSLLLGAAHALAASTHTGTWTASVRKDQLQLSLRLKGERGGQMGLPVPLASFQGLSTADGATAPFQLVREAGTFHFEGRFAEGEGAGHFRFEPAEAYARAMAGMGYPKLSRDEHFQLALFDVTPTRVKALSALGYKDIPLEELIQTGIFRVTPEFVREMRESGYPGVTLQDLIKLRIHGIDSVFVRSLSQRQGGREAKPQP